MPELPEVETTLQAIAPYLINAVVDKIVITQPKLRWPVSDELKDKVVKQKILKCWRRGKYLLLEQSQGACMIHLGMSGKLLIKPVGSKPELHDHVMVTAAGVQLHFNDPRRFGSVLWVNKPILDHKLLVNLGPEPLSSQFDAAYLYNNTRKKQVVVKSWLMNAANVVGVGNIYANEALFYAKIRPLRLAKTLTRKDCDILVDCVKKVLQKAIDLGGTTLKDFSAPDASSGYFQQKLKVYGRKEEPCVDCNKVITAIKINQRASFFCDYCQI